MSNNDPSDTSERKHQVSDLFDRVATTFDHVGPRFCSMRGKRHMDSASSIPDPVSDLFWGIFKPQWIRLALTLNIFNLLTASSVCSNVETDIYPLTNLCEEKEKRS